MAQLSHSRYVAQDNLCDVNRLTLISTTSLLALCHLTPAVSGRGERMRASGPLDCLVGRHHRHRAHLGCSVAMRNSLTAFTTSACACAS